MSLDPIGGYIFFSELPDRQSLLKLLLHPMELVPQDIKRIWVASEDEADDRDLSDLSWEQAISELASAHEGGFHVYIPTRSETYWFNQPVGPYQTVMINCTRNELDGKFNPSGGDRMARQWLALCEQGHANFGFFGQFEQMAELEYRDKQLPALMQTDITKLLEEWPAYWLLYLGPELAARWREAQTPIEALEQLWLPSGAFFARARTNLYN